MGLCPSGYQVTRAGIQISFVIPAKAGIQNKATMMWQLKGHPNAQNPLRVYSLIVCLFICRFFLIEIK